MGIGAGGTRRQSGGGRRRLPRPLHADAGNQPRHLDLQPRPDRSAGRRDRCDAVAQPAVRRRHQVQPTQRWPGGHRCDHRNSQACQRDSARSVDGEAVAAGPRVTHRPATRLPGHYVDDLPNVVDIAAIREAGVRIGADPLGGASVDYWGEIAHRHGLDLTVVNPLVDATWRFMTWTPTGRSGWTAVHRMRWLGSSERCSATGSATRSPPATTPTPTDTA